MEEFVKGFSPLEIVEQGLDGHTGTDEDRRSAQDLGIAMHDRRDTLHGVFLHDCFNIIPARRDPRRDVTNPSVRITPGAHEFLPRGRLPPLHNAKTKPEVRFVSASTHEAPKSVSA